MRYLKYTALAVIAALSLTSLSGCVLSRASQGNMEFLLSEGGESYILTRYKNTASQNELVIPDHFDGKPVTAIGEMAIQHCDDLHKIVIGANLAEIDKWGIFGNRYLKEFVVSEENSAFMSAEGVLFSKDMTRLVSYPNANIAEYDKNGALKEEVSYAVPEGVRSIAHCAFYECYALGEIILPKSLREIDTRAFHGCETMKQINLPEGLEAIGNDAFLRNFGLREIVIPSTVREIGDYAFYRCDNLERMTILAPKDALKQGHRWLPEPGRKPVEPVYN